MYPKVFRKETEIQGQKAFKFKYVNDMESLEHAVSRFKRFLKKVVSKQRGKTVVVVSHFDIIIGYLVEVGEGSYQKLMNVDFDHTGYYKLMADDGGIKVMKIVGLNVNQT